MNVKVNVLSFFFAVASAAAAAALAAVIVVTVVWISYDESILIDKFRLAIHLDVCAGWVISKRISENFQ